MIEVKPEEEEEIIQEFEISVGMSIKKGRTRWEST